ncbi:porphobilinogen synthase [Ferrithrix thermotolerans DSM 19514]|uniref:Delta-aminolevulinic acid dehydratase n=1 Tax=Ferrithrix thermotolerans DSM 19514 TaxID=1121881 RepID=A0A1M4SP42_9ACTN|nr:porphobilinogen synthase [Ferrithrix thermotolerans]SHE34013.1 porphobilinogen synthase [Ferrithrix thermotolerans DSM 19514]
MRFPTHRPRRLRSNSALRDLVAETSIAPSDFIMPYFVLEDAPEPLEIPSLPGVYQHTLSSLSADIKEIKALGIRAVILFGVPKHKDSVGSGAYASDGVVQRAIAQVKDAFGDEVVVFADLCLDEYTDHGHCGLIDAKGHVDNDSTLELYAQIAISQALAGVDFVAPSGMMDGQVDAIRKALDRESMSEVGILAYSAKYASGLYGPFRDAVNVEIRGGGDRKAYQQDYRNASESIREVLLDIEEGADMVMVKPAISYLDIISKVSEVSSVPLCAYHVSGEYAMVKAASEKGWIDGEAVALEQMYAVRRAGADMVITYFAKDLAKTMQRC